MKKHIALFSFLALFLVSVTGIAQTQKARTAVVNYDEASLDAALKGKVFEFTVKDITDAEAATMQKNGSYYTKTFTVKTSNSNDAKLFTVSFVNDPEMKIVYRYFVTNNISEVIYKGEKITAEDFFRQWMH